MTCLLMTSLLITTTTDKPAGDLLYLAVASSLPVTSMLPSSLMTMQLMLSSWSARVSMS